jgi:hypothetical protein
MFGCCCNTEAKGVRHVAFWRHIFGVFPHTVGGAKGYSYAPSPPATRMDYVAQMWKKWTARSDYVVDSAAPGVTHIYTSQLSGAGRAPQVSWTPDWYIPPTVKKWCHTFPYAMVFDPVSVAEGTAVWNDVYLPSTIHCDSVNEGLIDMAPIYSQIRALVLGAGLPDFAEWVPGITTQTAYYLFDDYAWSSNDSVINYDMGAVDPDDYTGEPFLDNLIDGGITLPSQTAAGIGWSIESAGTSIAFHDETPHTVHMMGFRGQLRHQGASSPFFVGRWRGTASTCGAILASGGGWDHRLELITTGTVNDGEIIGGEDDDVDHPVVPVFPDDPFPIASIGSNPICSDVHFIGLGTWADWLTATGHTAGDTYL